MAKTLSYRFVSVDDAPIRAKKDGRIRGRSPLYFSLSVDLGGWREMNLPGSFGNLTAEDPIATFNHNFDAILGRASAGTLKLRDGDDDAVSWTIETPDTQTGRDLLVSLERRDVKGASYTFMPRAGGETFTEVGRAAEQLEHLTSEDVAERALEVLEANAMDERDVVSFITSARLFEVGPVVNPAYPESDARERSAFQAWCARSPKIIYDRDIERELRLHEQRMRL